MARITIYKNSVLASLMSFLSYFLLLIGVVAAVNGEILGGVALFLIGIGVGILASSISERKRFKTWKKQIEDKGLIPAIQTDVQTALAVYNTFPGKNALEYIRTLNPAAADIISAQLAAKKEKT